MKPKIYLFVEHSAAWVPDIVARAIAEDGTILAGHICSDEEWAKHELGLTSERSHDTYRGHYPEGYEVIWGRPPEGAH
jgi:hypothetical protein